MSQINLKIKIESDNVFMFIVYIYFFILLKNKVLTRLPFNRRQTPANEANRQFFCSRNLDLNQMTFDI